MASIQEWNSRLALVKSVLNILYYAMSAPNACVGIATWRTIHAEEILLAHSAASQKLIASEKLCGHAGVATSVFVA
jgi:hypothetical protein